MRTSLEMPAPTMCQNSQRAKPAMGMPQKLLLAHTLTRKTRWLIYQLCRNQVCPSADRVYDVAAGYVKALGNFTRRLFLVHTHHAQAREDTSRLESLRMEKWAQQH